MKITVVCYRKAYPQEILTQLEPVLRQVGLDWVEIVALFQGKLREKGFEIQEISDAPGEAWNAGDVHYLRITNEGANATTESRLPAPQVLRPSEIIRYEDGTYRQGFRLHARGWPENQPRETLFIPAYNAFHVGDLVECCHDEETREWRPSGQTRRVLANWTEQLSTDSKVDPARS